MDKNNKRIRPSKDFNESERRAIIEEYLSGKISKVDIWRKYTGYEHEHGGLLRWMRELGYCPKSKNGTIFVSQPSILLATPTEMDHLEREELQKKIIELEKQLLEVQIKAEGYQLMIDIAEKELKIPIRKKSDAK